MFRPVQTLTFFRAVERVSIPVGWPASGFRAGLAVAAVKGDFMVILPGAVLVETILAGYAVLRSSFEGYISRQSFSCPSGRNHGFHEGEYFFTWRSHRIHLSALSCRRWTLRSLCLRRFSQVLDQENRLCLLHLCNTINIT
jgi:hypothetical protein